MSQVRASSEAIDERTCREILGRLASAGLLRYVVPAAHGGEFPEVAVAALAAVREALAYEDGLSDLLFVMQGLGSFPITCAGTEAQRSRYLPGVAAGELVAAFAVTEPGAGSDLGAIRTTARRSGEGYRLDGVKCFISNASFADVITVIARTGSQGGSSGLSAFVVERGAPGIEARADIDLIAPHPIGTIEFSGCSVPEANRLGGEGAGFGIAMATLDQFRTTVGGAAVGFAQRALDEALMFARSRVQFGKPIAEFEGIQFKLADVATKIEGARLLVAQAAEAVDRAGAAGPRADGARDRTNGAETAAMGRGPAAGSPERELTAGQPAEKTFPLSPLPENPSRAASMAKLFATEVAQEAADEAVQIHGGRGLVRGSVVERIYREVRALRIYEGTSEIQRTIIGRSLLRG